MRINHYKFPSDGSVDAYTRYLNGCQPLAGTGDRVTGTCTDAEFEISGISVSTAKKLLKKFGGYAWTEHCERNGGCFEVSEITLTGNNSRFKYNQHL